MKEGHLELFTDYLLSTFGYATATGLSRPIGSHHRHLAGILACDLLVLDDLGLQPISAQATQGLYEIITERYERGSMIITSNRAFKEWAKSFPVICGPVQPWIVLPTMRSPLLSAATASADAVAEKKLSRNFKIL